MIRGRNLDFGCAFLPDSMSLVATLAFLTEWERRFLSQVQGRSYAATIALIERAIGAKFAALAFDHRLGDPEAFEALVRFTEDEIKHRNLFREIDRMAAGSMPVGWRHGGDADAFAKAVLARPAWAVLAFVCHVEHFTQSHYLQAMESDVTICPVFRDVFRYHWREEAQHAAAAEIEWRRIDAGLTAADRAFAVTAFTSLLSGFDDVLRRQARLDAAYFLRHCGRVLSFSEAAAVEASVLAAYRWQYIAWDGGDGRFASLLAELATPAQVREIRGAIAALAERT